MLSCVAFSGSTIHHSPYTTHHSPLRHTPLTPLTAHNLLLPLCQLDGATGGSSMLGSASSALFNS